MAARPLINPTCHPHARNHLLPVRRGRIAPCLPLPSLRASTRDVHLVCSDGCTRADPPAAATLQYGMDVEGFKELLHQCANSLRQGADLPLTVPPKLSDKLLDELHDKISIPKLRGFFESIGFLILMEQPANAVTAPAVDDWIWTWITWGFVALWYFFVMPPIIFNWLRLRWYKRRLLEMYIQFMCVFLFFPSVLLWAPFLNFRQFPRDPSMKYPWSTPQESLVKDSTSS